MVEIQQYLNHPVTQHVKLDLAEQEESLMDTLLNVPVTDIESLIKHFEARGHLRGLKRSRAVVAEELEEVEEKLKETRK